MALKQQKDICFYDSQIAYLEAFMTNPNNDALVSEMKIEDRLQSVKERYNEVKSNDYINRLVGTIGADPLYYK